MADTFGFSLNDAKRIGKAVRLVERDEPRQQLGGQNDAAISRGVRLLIAKKESTSSWATGTTAVVTIYNGDTLASAVTVVARNQLLHIGTSQTCDSRWLALGHNGWGWYAIAQRRDSTATCTMEVLGVDFSTVANYQSTATQILGHESGCIKWVDVTNCTTA